MIETTSVQSPSARGAATLYKFRGRNLVTKQKIDIVLKGGESLPEADFEKRAVKFMYADATHMHFLDQQDYNQYSLTMEEIAGEAPYLTEALEGVQALIYNDECVGLQLPTSVELRVVECDPGVKGNSATSRNKPAKLETGLIVQVPEYLAQGELIKVDTRTGDFLSRA
jgi:elongation factor P